MGAYWPTRGGGRGWCTTVLVISLLFYFIKDFINLVLYKMQSSVKVSFV